MYKRNEVKGDMGMKEKIEQLTIQWNAYQDRIYDKVQNGTDGDDEWIHLINKQSAIERQVAGMEGKKNYEVHAELEEKYRDATGRK